MACLIGISSVINKLVDLNFFVSERNNQRTEEDEQGGGGGST